MTMRIRLLGHDAAIAHDAPEAIGPARLRRPEHVLLDSGLSDMNGYEIASPLQRTVASRFVG
jgi:CheY-like chemotaxis protein